MRRSVIAYEEQPGIWVVNCPSIGVSSQGDSLPDALSMIKDAIESYLEAGGIPDIETDVPITVASVDIDDEIFKPTGFNALQQALGIFAHYKKGPASISAMSTTDNGILIVNDVKARDVRDADSFRLRDLGWNVNVVGSYFIDLNRLGATHEQKPSNQD